MGTLIVIRQQTFDFNLNFQIYVKRLYFKQQLNAHAILFIKCINMLHVNLFSTRIRPMQTELRVK